MTSFPVFWSREWGHPRWRPEAEGPPYCASASMGTEKAAPSLGWRHFRRRHLESKMAAPQVTSGGRRNSRKSSERGRPSPKTCRRCLKFTLNEIEKHLIVSLPQPFLNWLRELPACHYGEVDQSARVNTPFHTNVVLTSASTYSTFFFFFFFFYGCFFFNCTLQ